MAEGVADPASPVVQARVNLTDLEREWAVSVAADAHFVYIVANGYAASTYRLIHSALHVVDASDPQHPVPVAELPLEAPPAHIAFAHGYLYLPWVEAQH